MQHRNRFDSCVSVQDVTKIKMPEKAPLCKNDKTKKNLPELVSHPKFPNFVCTIPTSCSMAWFRLIIELLMKLQAANPTTLVEFSTRHESEVGHVANCPPSRRFTLKVFKCSEYPMSLKVRLRLLLDFRFASSF
jgi:hypothetical protein